MHRLLLISVGTATLWNVGAQKLFAQGLGVFAQTGWSGPGFYLSWIKLLAVWLVFLFWVKTTDWISQDCQRLKLSHLRWNPIVFGSFLFVLLLVWFVPVFLASFPLLVISWLAPFLTYVVVRNKGVEPHQRVFTPDHMRFWMASKLSGAGVKVETEKKDPHEVGSPVKLSAQGAENERTDRVNLTAARQAPGFPDARQLVADAVARRATAMMLDFSQQGVGIRFMVDGVWHNGQPLEREVGDPALEALKVLCGLNSEDRQGRQNGTFAAEYEAPSGKSTQYDATLASQGTQTGERAILQFDDKKTHFVSFDDLGMRPPMQERLKELTQAKQGFGLISAMPSAGLKTTTHIVLRAMDRFMRDFTSVEEENHRYEVVENVKVSLYKGAEGQTPDSILQAVCHQEPEVLVVRDLVNVETVSILCGEIPKGRFIVSTIRAKDCAEALLRVLAFGVPPAEFAENLTFVLNQRLVRTLCEHCKEAYVPTPQVLKQLGIPQGRVDVFYRPPQQMEEPCEHCSGIGYVGRTALFELLEIDDEVRRVLATAPQLDSLRQAGRQAGMRTLQEEGIVLVAKGVTALAELMRVMKQ